MLRDRLFHAQEEASVQPQITHPSKVALSTANAIPAPKAPFMVEKKHFPKVLRAEIFLKSPTVMPLTFVFCLESVSASCTVPGGSTTTAPNTFSFYSSSSSAQPRAWPSTHLSRASPQQSTFCHETLVPTASLHASGSEHSPKTSLS